MQRRHGSRSLLVVSGLVRDDGAQLALGLAMTLAGSEMLKHALDLYERDLAEQGRALPPFFAQFKRQGW